MSYLYRPDLQEAAKKLRREQTEEEKMLYYQFLNRLPYPVKRQKPIGNYIVDFYIPKSKTVIELDGSQHAEPNHVVQDAERDRYLSGLGIKVLRFSNYRVHKDFQGICSELLFHLNLTETDLKPKQRCF